ncbi:E3 ubiquitin-protein ligase MIB2-like [Hibiscus syriacus]|uniref:E3 ubiquitin-protein ligase MIB2-like n=1 Tax=Hibiscus syriacus TaxID=106335 RepID=UPI001924E1F2|nr:E3 ubiquitin-protein ligase MIB2-like [Hibiscus syriacus]
MAMMQVWKMEKRLYDAAVEGSKISLLNLLHEDALLLDRFITGRVTSSMPGRYPETPLHVASMLGHLEFVDEILTHKPELAKELDSRKSSPLHLAAAKGNLQVAKNLLQVNLDMCHVCDVDGRNPIHIAAMKGLLGLLRELVDARPWAARVLMEQGETILHACVRCNQLDLGCIAILPPLIKKAQGLNAAGHQSGGRLPLLLASKPRGGRKGNPNRTERPLPPSALFYSSLAEKGTQHRHKSAAPLTPATTVTSQIPQLGGSAGHGGGVWQELAGYGRVGSLVVAGHD